MQFCYSKHSCAYTGKIISIPRKTVRFLAAITIMHNLTVSFPWLVICYVFYLCVVLGYPDRSGID